MKRIEGWAFVRGTYAPAASPTVTVYEHGTATLATIYDDDLAAPTPKANPFTGAATGYWFFYAAASKRYDVQLSGASVPVTFNPQTDAPAGLGDGGVPGYTTAGLPTAGNAAHAGRLARVTDGQGGLYLDSGTAWAAVLDAGGIGSATLAGLPAAGTAGRLRRVTNDIQGLHLDDGAAWASVLAYAFPNATRAGLPAAALAGRVRRVTDDARGLWLDTATRWFGLAGEVANVVEFGAARDGSTNDLTAIQAAIDALTSGGVVYFPKGTYGISGPILLRNDVKLLGWGATIQGVSFSGDSLIRAYRREDNTPGNEDRICVEGVELVWSTASAAGIDLTGCCNSLVLGVTLDGPGTGTAGTGIRLADQNPLATSNKRCQNNQVIQCYGVDLSKFLVVFQATADRCVNNIVQAFRATCRTGVDLSGVTAGVPRLVLVSGQLTGDGDASSVAMTTTVKRGVVLLGVTQSGFTSAGGHTGEVMLNDLQGDNASGTTAAAAIAQSGTTSVNFANSAYLKLSSGTILAAGANTYTYTLLSAPTGATFRISPVSGIPTTPCSFQGSLSGNTLTVTVVAAASVTLSADFVFRAEQVAP